MRSDDIKTCVRWLMGYVILTTGDPSIMDGIIHTLFGGIR
jgi:hypothetical protein